MAAYFVSACKCNGMITKQCQTNANVHVLAMVRSLYIQSQNIILKTKMEITKLTVYKQHVRYTKLMALFQELLTQLP